MIPIKKNTQSTRVNYETLISPTGVTLNIQANSRFSCTPRENLPLMEYTRMEVNIFTKEELYTSVMSVTGNKELEDSLVDYYSTYIDDISVRYHCVPISKIQELCEELNIV